MVINKSLHAHRLDDSRSLVLIWLRLHGASAGARVIANTITAPSGANASAAIRSLSRSINSTGLVRSVALAAMVSSGIGSSKNRTLINQQVAGCGPCID